MRKLLLVTLALSGAVMSANVLAQTCAQPLAIHSHESGLAGDTCGATNAFPSYPGGIPSPQNDVVYSFVAQDANATIAVQGSGTLTAPGWVVLAPCDAVNGNIVASGSNAGGTASGTVSGLTNGTTYYVAVTTDPGAGQPNDNCGTFTVDVTGILPVELQSFSVQ